MWLENLKEIKKAKGMSVKQIAEQTNLPERTVSRIFSGDTPNPYIDTIHRIAIVLDCSLDEILADTKVVVATESLIEVKENAEVAEAERDLVFAENEVLKTKNSALATEVELLKRELQHKEELLAVYKYFTKICPEE